MAVLTEAQKSLVVCRLATFCTPTEISKEVEEVFGVKATLDQIMFYDPMTANGSKQLGSQWRELFARTREDFIADTSSIAVAHKTYRLRELDRMIRAAKSPDLKARLLEQAAKEEGGLYTNKRDLTTNGKDIGSLSDADLISRAKALVAGVVAQGADGN